MDSVRRENFYLSALLRRLVAPAKDWWFSRLVPGGARGARLSAVALVFVSFVLVGCQRGADNHALVQEDAAGSFLKAMDAVVQLASKQAALTTEPTVTILDEAADLFILVADGESTHDFSLNFSTVNFDLGADGSGNRVHVYLDGSKVGTAYSSPFTVPAVPIGQHRLAVVLAEDGGFEDGPNLIGKPSTQDTAQLTVSWGCAP